MQSDLPAQVIFADLPVPCLLVNAQGEILTANILLQEHLNVSEKRMLGQHLTTFISPADEVAGLLKRALNAETISSDAFYTVRGHRPYTLYASQQADGYISVILIAEGNRLEAEVQSRRHEVAEAVSRIALERAHEIKNPLAALRGATQLLSEQVRGDALEIIQHMLTDVDRIKERVDGFLQVGPRANIQMHPINIHILIDDVVKDVDGIQIQRAFDPSIPDLVCHERRLRQAIENLWSNAIEACSDLIVWQTRIEHGVILSEHRGAVLSIKITSNGVAIPAHIRDKMFEPYVTAKSRGNGLGLSIVQQVVQEHGGKVVVNSELMRTSFTVYLPLKTEKK
ncbi:MAG: ATP-binding protein [Ghiorsea sp.]|nr:ATP-binding protein [Ghiorsea sp.]